MDEDQTQTPPTQPEIHPAIGVADGQPINGERVVYERDEKGQVVSWHKEVMTLEDKAALGDSERVEVA